MVGFGGQRLVVDGDKAGDVALLGFDDVFDGVAMVVRSAEKISERAVGLGSILTILDGSADQGGPVCCAVPGTASSASRIASMRVRV